MPSLDTNILLRLYLGAEHGNTDDVKRLLAKHQSFAVSDLAITEAVYVLEKIYKLPRSDVALFLRSLLNNQYLNFNRQLFGGHLQTAYTGNTQLSFNDCCLVVYAELNGQTPLYTLDQQLAKKLQNAQTVT